MRIAITGASGRVGRAVTAMALAGGHEVVAIDRVAPADQGPALTAAQVDLASYDDLRAALDGCEGLIHLAAIPSPAGHPEHEVHNNNVVSSYNALSAAVAAGIRHIAQASSVNAVGAAYSRWPRYDYFPLDERHPTYNEDPYSLSKWVCELQGDSLARRHEGVSIASLRFHWVVADRETAARNASHHAPLMAKHLWGYTRIDSAARACLLAMGAGFSGHEVFQIVAPDTMMAEPSLELRRQFFPDVPLRGDLSDRAGFFDCSKAEHLLGWRHEP